MSGWLFLAMGAFVTFGDFVLGFFLWRRGVDASTLLADGRPLEAEARRRAGRLIMLVSPFFFLVLALLALGLIPRDGIEPISLGGAR